jgi:hypothetical protein
VVVSTIFDLRLQLASIGSQARLLSLLKSSGCRALPTLGLDESRRGEISGEPSIGFVRHGGRTMLGYYHPSVEGGLPQQASLLGEARQKAVPPPKHSVEWIFFAAAPESRL